MSREHGLVLTIVYCGSVYGGTLDVRYETAIKDCIKYTSYQVQYSLQIRS